MTGSTSARYVDPLDNRIRSERRERVKRGEKKRGRQEETISNKDGRKEGRIKGRWVDGIWAVK